MVGSWRLLAFFSAMLGSIEVAEQYVLFGMYLFESGRVANRFIAVLTRAPARGGGGASACRPTASARRV
jgi:hypothetical protein